VLLKVGGNLIELFKPLVIYDDGIKEVLERQNLNYSIYGSLFEDELGKFIGNPNVSIVNSFNLAYYIIFRTLNLEKGDLVLLSPLACLESTMPIISYGLSVKWVDIDAKTGTMSPEDLKSKITKHTKLIIHSHFCGNPGYIDEINQIANSYNVPIIEDANEAFGSKYKEKYIGNHNSDFVIFSFSYVRIPNTLGGAAIFTKSSKLNEKIKIIRDNGINREGFRKHNGEINEMHDIVQIGYSGLMSEFNSYLGVKQIQVIQEKLEQQRMNALSWREHIRKLDFVVSTIYLPCSESNYWVFGVLVSSKNLAMDYFKMHGFKTSSIHLPNNYYSLFPNDSNLPNTKMFHEHFLALPSGWFVDITNSLNKDDTNV